MRRREFLAAMAAAALTLPTQLRGQALAHAPRLLISDTDPFTGIDILKSRYAAGRRPSDDMEGWALSWRITGKAEFAERALAELKTKQISRTARASRTWLDYARLALAFDWLRDYSGFDSNSQGNVAEHLQAGRAAILATPDFAEPGEYSYHNYAVRYLALAQFTSAALEGIPAYRDTCNLWREPLAKCLANVLDVSSFVSPDGSYHESMDYMRITWASLVMIAELQRTTLGVDPAFHFPVFRNIGNTYLYKLLPDGTPSREGDNEYPLLDARDRVVVGYAVNRFKDPYSAWLLRKSGFFPQPWLLPVLEFLWDDPDVTPRDPALADESELPRQRYFSGVGHLVIRDGWKPDSTWIEFDCGPYLAKHQHLDQNQFTIYHCGYLAIDSGADYTDTESPHYLNYFRRTVAHNSVLIYDPAETFFWSDNVVPAANDGGQRMDSARYWNTVRSRADFERTRDLWDLGSMLVTDYQPGQYHYAMGDATRAYQSHKLRRFTREIVYLPSPDILLVFDRVVSANPQFRKAWLLHGVNPPVVDRNDSQVAGSSEFPDAKTFRFREGSGELLVHSLLPRQRVITRRGGSGSEFVTPGDDLHGPWGSGQNWPLDPAQGGPLPDDPKLRHMWKEFWGDDFDRILPSNRRNVVPGAWRIEVSPAQPAEEDFFLHVLEIGKQGSIAGRHVELIDGVNFQGAAIERGPTVLFSSSNSPVEQGEVSLPNVPSSSLLITSLRPHAVYELNFGGPNISSVPTAVLPGVSAGTVRLHANEKDILRLERESLGNLRLRLSPV